ncbi:hypothetical protein F5X96DRAFT_665120 [Biscogniauxia mediterranea]|nr:hypothetical protein F5X96DRAFT_665120 [Biscogniauxia mediterranea]
MDARGSDRPMFMAYEGFHRGINLIAAAINDAGNGVLGSGDNNEPEWGGRADPKRSPDGAKVVYWQDPTASLAWGGANPLPCYNSTYPGARPYPMWCPWDTLYVPGDVVTSYHRPPQGTYTLEGKVSSPGNVVIMDNANRSSIQSVAVQYRNSSDDSLDILNGYDNYTRSKPSPTLEEMGPNGIHIPVKVFENIFEEIGSSTTVVNSQMYLQPANHT